MKCSFLELLIFVRLALVNIHTSKKYCIKIQAPKETNNRTDINSYIFWLFFDIDVEKYCFFLFFVFCFFFLFVHVELKFLLINFFILFYFFNFSHFHHVTIICTYYRFVLFLKVIKQPFRRGVNFNYVRVTFSSQQRSETSFDV